MSRGQITFRKALVAGAATMALAGATLIASASPAAAAIGPSSPGWPYGCPLRYVCLYTNTAGPAGTYPSGLHANYFYYRYYNLSNVLGNHWIVNNQTDGAKAYPCLGYGGTNCTTYSFFWPDDRTTTSYIPAGKGRVLNFTPINSIRLTS